jgi:hypothetical protein
VFRVTRAATFPRGGCLEELALDSIAASDLVVLDARHLAPVEVDAFVAGMRERPLVLIAPRGLRTESIPAGVRGALTYLSDSHELRVALDVVRSGQRYISPHFAAEDRLRYWLLPTPPTARQREVFERKQRGMKNAELAIELGVVRKAVESIVTELRLGFGLTSGQLFDWRDGRLD